MGILKDRFLILTLIFGFLIRLILTPLPGFKFDVDTWFAWAERLNNIGFANFYSDQVWTGYTPGFLYILAILGFIKNLFHINSSLFYILLKFPSLLSEILMGLMVYQIILINFSKWRKIGLTFIMFNPGFIFNSSIFGQFDGLFSLTLLLTIYFLNQKKLISSSFFYGVSFLLKPQAIFLIPVFSLYVLKNFSPKNIAQLIFPTILVILLSFLPFFLKDPINGPINLISNLLGYYPYNSIFAYNFWGIFGFWIADNKTWMNINYQNWGYILFGIFWIITSLLYFRKKISLLSLSTLAALSFFFLLTRMHERYLYPSLIFLIIVALFKKSKVLVILSIVLSLVHFIDLYYVYIYYNQFYLKLPKVIYISSLYNLADKNPQLISLFAIIIFFFIVFFILKLNDENTRV